MVGLPATSPSFDLDVPRSVLERLHIYVDGSFRACSNEIHFDDQADRTLVVNGWQNIQQLVFLLIKIDLSLVFQSSRNALPFICGQGIALFLVTASLLADQQAVFNGNFSTCRQGSARRRQVSQFILSNRSDDLLPVH